MTPPKEIEPQAPGAALPPTPSAVQRVPTWVWFLLFAVGWMAFTVWVMSSAGGFI